MTAPLNKAVPLLDENRRMTNRTQDFFNELYKQIPIRGTGSPEGVVQAEQFQKYIDTTGASGSIEYIKRDTDVAGDTSKGWIAV